jgi:hypothetical protein
MVYYTQFDSLARGSSNLEQFQSGGNMKALFLTLLGFLLCAVSAVAEVPQRIPYQGRLTEPGGAPVADGAHLVKFIIYDDSVGGSELWNSGFQNVVTTDGVFSYELGSAVALPDDLFTDTTRWLGITVGVDPELSPRTHLATVPYAYHALRADSAGYVSVGPGVTQNFGDFNGDLIVPDLNVLVVQDSIFCPDSGYVIADVNLSVYCNVTNGTSIILFIWIDSGNGGVNYWDQMQHLWYLPATLPTGQYATIMSKRAVFGVGPGWRNFHTLALHQSGDTERCGFQPSGVFTLLYVPNAYNRVESFTTSGASPMQTPESRQKQ